ncbi:MAG TPA: hypothetical protein VN222_18375 [Novosphingobium sp.]|nr:hypothetical protein [Novosphingobium sp.]
MTMLYYLGPDMPHDLFAAAGGASLPGWNIDRAMPVADRWLESKFALWARSVVQDWADGAFDHADAMVFSRADDTAQRLYYYLCEMRRLGEVKGPEPLILDIAKAARTASQERTAAALRALQARLGVSDAALEAGIAATNARREGVPAAPVQGRTCLLAGSPAPDGRLRAIASAAGWQAAGATLAEMWEAPGAPVAANTGDPAAAIAAQLHASPAGPRGFYDRGAALLADVARHRAAAAILWFAEEEEALGWHLPAQIRALSEAGVPHLVLTRRDWRAGDGVADEISTFLKGVAA